MNINHLKFIKAVSEEGSFSKAAKICNVTQPTLSNGIAKLEGILGQKLFKRNTRTIEITSFGEKIISDIKAIIELEESIYLYSKEFSNPQTVVVKIGLSPLLNTRFVSMLTKSFTENNDKYKILLIERDLNSLEEKLKNGELDIILIPKIKKTKIPNTIHLYDESLVYLDNNIKDKNEITIKEIRNKTFVMVPDTCGLSEIVRSLVGTSRQKINEYEGKAMSYQVLSDWASNGLGSAILPISKIPDGTLSKKIKDSKVSFVAKWRASELAPLRSLIQYFKDQSLEIYKGLI